MVSFRRMVLWRLILLLISAVNVQVQSQLDNNGFISIDCGLPEGSSYVDDNSLNYVSDEKFIDTGSNSNISSDYVKNYSKEYLTVRYFPNETRNCYTLRSLNVTTTYLIRGGFYYGNYDNKNDPPTFDIYVGVNLWDTVNASSPSNSEIIVQAITDSLEVCLVNKGQGTPFISWLHLRQLTKDMYRYVGWWNSLVLVQRDNVGARIPVVRYPDDKYDRWWYNNDPFNTSWSAVSTNATISYIEPDYDTPSLVLQTAATTASTNDALVIAWRSDNTSTQYYYILHFYEIEDTSKTGSRDFYIIEGGYTYSSGPPQMNASSGAFYGITSSQRNDYNISLLALNTSALPPIINAFELYIVAGLENPTDNKDVVAINRIKKNYGIKKKGWIGDPCLPSHVKWTHIDCSDSYGSSSIISLNLSSSSLTGPLIDSFGNLTALENLNLSNNELSGNLSFIDGLPNLKNLDIRGNNNLLTTLPSQLSSKQVAGTLTYWCGHFSPSPTPPSPSSSKKLIIVIAVVVPLLVIAVVIAFVLGQKRRNYKRSIAPKPNESFEFNIPQSGDPNFGNRKFSYNDLKKITNDFKNNIGTGGYGNVYLGLLENGVQVAVKMLSQSSSQGVKEFLAEAENLARVHHKNLVSLMGYGIDKRCMALVYEYMQEGNLRDKLKDNIRPLDWKQRLQIAYESALVNNTFQNKFNEGLEYLHKACNPPLIHRDVKTNNILLNANLEAKIADFGLSRAFNNDVASHVSTRIVGTPGYLDPEYYLSNQLSTKSDVFSFGVVLLEIITGRAPINERLEQGNLIQWVREKLSGGDIKSIVDPKMQSKYDINSVWKVTDLACKCTEFSSSERPTMAVVVAELKESLELEMSMEEIHIKSTETIVTDVSQESTFEMAFMGGMPVPGPSER